MADTNSSHQPPEPDARAVAAETRRLRAMQRAADRAEIRLRRGGLSKPQQARLIAEARVACMRLFPDKLYLFDIIYMPRFRRAIAHAEQEEERSSRDEGGASECSDA